jgi:hypothetical protein
MKFNRFLWVAVWAGLWLVPLSSAQNQKVKVGEKAPDFALKTLDGKKTVKLSDYKGKKVVLMNWWASF